MQEIQGSGWWGESKPGWSPPIAQIMLINLQVAIVHHIPYEYLQHFEWVNALGDDHCCLIKCRITYSIPFCRHKRKSRINFLQIKTARLHFQMARGIRWSVSIDRLDQFSLEEEDPRSIFEYIFFCKISSCDQGRYIVLALTWSSNLIEFGLPCYHGANFSGVCHIYL